MRNQRTRFDTGIVLSHKLEKNPGGIWVLTKEAISRLDGAVSMYYNEEFGSLTLSGGHGSEDRDSVKTHAEVMNDYVLSIGISQENIHLEPDSLDTVGQVVFTKLGIVVPKNMQRLKVISQLSHIGRIRAIVDFVYGSDFEIAYRPTPNVSHLDTEKERKSLEAFYNTFKGISPGSNSDILERLFGAHPFYISRQDLREKYSIK